MRGITMKGALMIVACAAAPALAHYTDEPVQVNTSGLQEHVAREVQRHADDGMRSLMGYLWFTRKIHRLWIDDVTKPKPDAVAIAEAPQGKREKYEIRTSGLR